MIIYTKMHRGGRGYMWECTVCYRRTEERSKALYAINRGSVGICEKHLLTMRNYLLNEFEGRDYQDFGVCVPFNWPETLREAALKYLMVLFPESNINNVERGDEKE